MNGIKCDSLIFSLTDSLHVKDDRAYESTGFESQDFGTSINLSRNKLIIGGKEKLENTELAPLF